MTVLFWLSTLVLAARVQGQLALPNPQYMPQDASVGAQQTPPQAQSSLPNAQWTSLLANQLLFYEAQRSGKLPGNNRIAWRNDSCLDDGKDAGVDLSGGYFDAGDYIKCTFPMSFAVTQICWGATDFGKGYDDANQTAYLDDMLRHSLDWLMKAHPAERTLYIQVADTEVDNNYWGDDQNMPKPRPSYQVNDTSPGTDVAASVSAAFSACSNLYASRTFSSAYSSPATLQNQTYAATLLKHAQDLYSFATNATGGQKRYQDSVPAAKGAYPSTSFGDELAFAALFLARATGDNISFVDQRFWDEAKQLYSKYNLQFEDGIFNWDGKTPGVLVLLSQLAHLSPNLKGDLGTWQTATEKYFDRIINGGGRSRFTPGGLLYYDGESDDASLNPSLNAAMLMMRYAPIASSDAKKTAYLQFAQKQLDYTLGSNPMSAPYIVGANPNSPSNPHSAPASGGTDLKDINSYPTKHILYGAVIGGPDKNDKYFDLRDDWPQTEIALDYNAPMLTLAAAHVMSDTNDPFYTRLAAGEYQKRKPDGTPCDGAYDSGCPDEHTGLPMAGKIALAVILTVVGLAFVLGITYWIYARRRYKKGG